MSEVGHNCPECGYDILTFNTHTDTPTAMQHFHKAYVPILGEFRFTVSCESCEWSEYRRIPTEKIQE